MRIILGAFFFILFFTSCQTKEQKEEKERIENFKKRMELTEKAVNSKERIDSIFMNFRFGMTEKEYDMHLQYITNKTGAQKNILGIYEIPINASYGFRYKATLHPEYYNGALCRLTIMADEEIGKTDDSYIMLFSSVKKAHPEYAIYIDKSIEGFPKYMAFYKNLIVSCYSSGSYILIYEDAPVCRILDEEEEKKDSIELVNTF